MGAKESGLSFLAGVLAKLPESIRAQADAIFKDPQAEAAVVALGDGTLARSDYSKHMDDLKTKEAELEDLRTQNLNWYETNKGALDEYLKIKPEYDKLKGGNPTPNPNPNPTPPPVDLKVIEDSLEQRDRAFASAFALGVTLSARHQQMFNEPLDMQALMADSRLGQPIKGQPGRVFGLQDVYDAVHGERVRTKAKEAEDARIQKLVEEKLAEERRKLPQQPFPVRGVDPSPLDVLQATDRKPSDYTVDTAVAEYNRLQQARAS